MHLKKMHGTRVLMLAASSSPGNNVQQRCDRGLGGTDTERKKGSAFFRKEDGVATPQASHRAFADLCLLNMNTGANCTFLPDFRTPPLDLLTDSKYSACLTISPFRKLNLILRRLVSSAGETVTLFNYAADIL